MNDLDDLGEELDEDLQEDEELLNHSDELFYARLAINPEALLNDLSGTSQQYYKEAVRKVHITGRVQQAIQKREDRKNKLFMDYRLQKEKGDKSLTEAVITAAIANDSLFVHLNNEVTKLHQAESLQVYRIEAVRMKHSALKVMAERVQNERIAESEAGF